MKATPPGHKTDIGDHFPFPPRSIKGWKVKAANTALTPTKVNKSDAKNKKLKVKASFINNSRLASYATPKPEPSPNVSNKPISICQHALKAPCGNLTYEPHQRRRKEKEMIYVAHSPPAPTITTSKAHEECSKHDENRPNTSPRVQQWPGIANPNIPTHQGSRHVHT
eukprot:g73216.t1